MNSITKLENANEDDPRWQLYKKKNWISEDPEVLKLIEHGYVEFELKTAERIIRRLVTKSTSTSVLTVENSQELLRLDNVDTVVRIGIT